MGRGASPHGSCMFCCPWPSAQAAVRIRWTRQAGPRGEYIPDARARWGRVAHAEYLGTWTCQARVNLEWTTEYAAYDVFGNNQPPGWAWNLVECYVLLVLEHWRYSRTRCPQGLGVATLGRHPVQCLLFVFSCHDSICPVCTPGIYVVCVYMCVHLYLSPLVDGRLKKLLRFRSRFRADERLVIETAAASTTSYNLGRINSICQGRFTSPDTLSSDSHPPTSRSTSSTHRKEKKPSPS